MRMAELELNYLPRIQFISKEYIILSGFHTATLPAHGDGKPASVIFAQ